MAANNGKVFEQNFKESIPEHVWKYRPPDSGGGQMARFTSESICDLIAFNPADSTMFLFELKSTVGISVGFRNTQDVAEYEAEKDSFQNWFNSLDSAARKNRAEEIKLKRRAVRAAEKKLNAASIKYHQMNSLKEADSFGISAYIVFYFIKLEKAYAMHINDFMHFWGGTSKKSINTKDIEAIIENSEFSFAIPFEAKGRSKVNKVFDLKDMFS